MTSQVSESKYKHKIIDKKVEDIFGVLLWDQETLDQIWEDSGYLARNNEFQFHYWAIIGSTTKEGQELNVSVPLVIFNYEQEVAGSSIDFDLKKVEQTSKDTEPIAIEKANEFMGSKMKQDIEEEFDIDTWKVVPLQGTHVHP